MNGQNYNQPEHQNQVHCDECGEEINGTVFGATMGRYLCGMCADEYRERQWEQHTTSDEWDRQAISDEPPADQRYYEYPTCEYCGTQHSCWIPCPDTGGKQTVMAMQDLPLCEVFTAEEIKRLEFLRHRIVTGQIDPRS